MIETPIMLDIVDGRFHLDASPRLKDLIKQIPGFNYSGEGWTAPVAWPVAKAARGVLGPSMEITPAVQAWAEGAISHIEFIDVVRAGHVTDPLLSEKLYPFQATGSTYLGYQERAILADEMGTGKTVQSVEAVRLLGQLDGRPSPVPALIVCTGSMRSAWVDHVHEWTDLRAVATGDTKPKRVAAIEAVAVGQADVLVIPWHHLALHSRLAPYPSVALSEEEKTPKELNGIRWQAVIADEAHKGKDPKTKWTRALWQLADGAEYVWALTGTPVTGKVEDLWAALRLVAPTGFSSRSRFLDRYALMVPNHFAKGRAMMSVGLNPLHEEELRAAIRPYILRRTKAEVLPQLPPKIRSTRRLTMGTKQAAAYKAMDKEGMYLTDDGQLVMATDGIVKYGRMSQLSSATPVFVDVEVEMPDGTVRTTQRIVEMTMPSNKVDALLEILEEAPGESLVVGAESRKLIELAAAQLARKGISVGLITGAQSEAERDMAKRDFQAGVVQVLLLTLGTGAEGLTLTRANRLVFLQASYESVKNDQFEDRIHRIGQEAGSVEIIYLVTEDTVDERRPEAADAKRQLAKTILGDT